MNKRSWTRIAALAALLALVGSACKKSKDDGAGSAATAPGTPAASGGATTGPGSASGAGTTTPAAPTGPDSARLPKPAATTAASPDEAAAALARLVLAGGDGALPALLAALEQSGIDVRDMDLENRVVNAPAEPRQGMAFQAGEVVLLDRLRQQGYSFELRSLAEVLAASYQAPPEQHVERLLAWEIVKALRRHAEGELPTTRFWARFIIELGRQGPGEYDLLDPDGMVGIDGKVPLDGVQLGLILLRLSGDLELRRVAAGTAGGRTDAEAPEATARRALPRLPGGWYAVRPGTLARRVSLAGEPWAATSGLLFASLQGSGTGAGGSGAGSGSASGTDCNMSAAAGTAMDAGATAATTIFGEAIEAAAGAAGEAFSRGLGILNAGLSLLKFFLNGLLLEVKIELADGAGRLERTRSDTSDGRTLEAKATVRLNAGGLRYLNCFRIMLNAAGVDFNVGNDGPIDNAKVTWKLYRGGATGSGDIGIAQFRGNPQTTTDGEGVAKITIEGKRQRRRDIPEAAAPLDKPASLGIELVLKDSSLAQDLVDAIGAATGGAIGVAISLLERMAPFGAERAFTVVDWVSDYRVDWQDPRGMRIYGGTCERPEGAWNLAISGHASQQGFTINFGGRLDANINADFRGDFSGSMSAANATIPLNIPPLVVNFDGDARFVPGRNAKLILHSERASGGMHGPAGMGDQDIRVDWDYNSSLPQTINLPVEVGSFCEGSEE